MKKILFGTIAFAIVCMGYCNGKKEKENKMSVNTYYSLDSLFSVNIPSIWPLQETPLNNYLCFHSEDNHVLISIERTSLMNVCDFHDWVQARMKLHDKSKYSIHLLEKNDTAVHYKISLGLFYAHNIYLRKQVGLHNYLLDFSYNSLSPDKKIIKGIYSSLKEHPLANFSTNITEDDGYTFYSEYGFAIDKSYILEQNQEYIQMYKQIHTKHLGDSRLLAALICVQNLESRDSRDINIINVNVNEALSEECIDNYANTLKINKIQGKKVRWHGNTAIEYDFTQYMGDGIDVPTKAIYCYHDSKLYLVQIASLSNIDSKFRKLKESFIFNK